MSQLKRYIIERDIPGIGGMSVVELCGAARASNCAIEQVGQGLQWQHSYITSDNLWCVYKAENEEFLREHAKRGKFPCDNIREVVGMLSPATAEVLV